MPESSNMQPDRQEGKKGGSDPVQDRRQIIHIGCGVQSQEAVMWNLDDQTRYTPFLRKSMPYVFTWGDDYRHRREQIRAAISEGGFPQIPSSRVR
jgi:hypothetical protein